MITPETVVAANTRGRNATAMQTSRSVCHQPAIRSVATTDVAHPLTMLTAQAATAVRPLGSSIGAPAKPPCPLRRGAPRSGDGGGGIWVVGDADTVGIGPVGARLIIREPGSYGDGG